MSQPMSIVKLSSWLLTILIPDHLRQMMCPDYSKTQKKCAVGLKIPHNIDQQDVHCFMTSVKLWRILRNRCAIQAIVTLTGKGNLVCEYPIVKQQYKYSNSKGKIIICMSHRIKYALHGRGLTPTRDRLSAALGILGLMLLSEKGLYQSGTDKCLINMQQQQLQGSTLWTKDYNTDKLCNNSNEMPLYGYVSQYEHHIGVEIAKSTDSIGSK